MSWARAPRIACTTGLCALYACSNGSQGASGEIHSRTFSIMGDVAETWQREMPAGVFLVETRETDVDVLMIVDAAGRRVELADEVGRHGHTATVVALTEPGPIRVALRNLDYRTMTGKFRIVPEPLRRTRVTGRRRPGAHPWIPRQRLALRHRLPVADRGRRDRPLHGRVLRRLSKIGTRCRSLANSSTAHTRRAFERGMVELRGEGE